MRHFTFPHQSGHDLGPVDLNLAPWGIPCWERRAQLYGRCAVLNLGHAPDQFDTVTQRQKAILLPLVKQSLRGNEKRILDFGCGPGCFTELRRPCKRRAHNERTKNQGTADVTRSPPGPTRLYLSTYSTCDSADIILASRSIASLAAGATDSAAIPIQISAGN